ncbi:VOC family protein [Antribacter gilvus]|uniref:VOC family protein n=1 Tax=Antribacter gilvus TaxID=2304675 RepID=UPI001F0BB3E1|nr:VOC family protein [Antribacter gilvus]
MPIYVNLPVADLDASKAFYEGLGFSINPQFTDENAAAVVIEEGITVMLLRRDFFTTFTKRPIATDGVEVITSIEVDSREKADELAEKAFATGGAETMEPQDMGWMYSRAFADPDGHHWELMYADEAAMAEAFAAEGTAAGS